VTDQEILVRHLAEQSRALLAGDHSERKVIRQLRPSQVLQLGVLPPLPTPDADSKETAQELAQRFNMPPSQMGLSFIVRPDGDRVEIEAAGEFSFYLQRYPDRDEQKAHQGGTEDGAAKKGGDGDGAGAGKAGGGTEGRSRLVEVYERFDIQSDRLRFEIDLTKDDRGSGRVSLDRAVRKVLGPALEDPRTVYPFKASQVLPNSATDGSDADYWKAIGEQESNSRKELLYPPEVVIEIDWRRQADGNVRVLATLVNLTQEPAKQRRKKGEPAKLRRELHLFNAKLRVFERTGRFEETKFREMPEDFRYADKRWVWATGQNCVGRRMEEDENTERPLTTETWPLYRQAQMVPNRDPELQISFHSLAGSDFMKTLRRIAGAMDDFEAAWRQELASWADPKTKAACEDALREFHDRDVLGFQRGLRCLADDRQLQTAFRAANEVFRRSGEARQRPIATWRLFQVVYQVIQLAALRARQVDEPELLAELDVVDVLWFPTGGGKTEAYLGLIVVAMFYDRLRGKERGVTSILRFPLRMLSVQQLQRILDVLWFAERHRRQLLDSGEQVGGDEFRLGYWVGRGNSPNSLTNRKRKPERDHIEWWAEYIATDASQGDDLRILTNCPNPACHNSDVKLEADVEEVRLRHRCQTCGEELPVVISDDEVYRYLPAVLVCTVDKLAHVARAHQFVGILAGPAYRCPKHGYFTHHEAVFKQGSPAPVRDDRCIAGELCTLAPEEYELVPKTVDPCPALQIQDELHLLEEELGTFDAHYETLMESMQRLLGNGKPAKLLAATATIEAYEEQVRHLYAREARIFPSPGWDLDSSFYVETTEEARRIYVGALPNRPDPREFGERVQANLHDEVIRMQRDPSRGLAVLREKGLDPSRDEVWLEDQLLNYELSLGYVNQKRDGESIAQRLARRDFGDPPERLQVQVLASEVAPLAKIAEILDLIGVQYRNSTPREDRLRALVATSIVSHGVDLDPLNLMVMNGMTPAVAGYVQASSRSGRTHVGLVIVGFDRRKARERSFYQYFLKYHEFLNRLIAPVPVNRFAKFAAERTLPGVMSALLLQVYNRERLERAGLDPAKPRRSLLLGSEVRKWWGSADGPADKTADLKNRSLAALGIGKRVLVANGGGKFESRRIFDPIMEASLRGEAEVAIGRQVERLLDQGGNSLTAMRFRPRPLSSFRDVDEPMEFCVSPAWSDIEMALTSNRSES